MLSNRKGWRRSGRAVTLAWAFLHLVMAAGDLMAQDAATKLRIDLNIPALRIDVYEGRELVKRYPVAVGQLGHDTPEGSFTISRAEWNPWWRPPPGRDWTRGKKVTPPGPDNPMGCVKLFFAPLYYIHGTPDETSLGSPASHGCVRMLNKDVIELATLIHDHAGATVPVSEIDQILGNPRRTRNVTYSDSVTFTIRYKPVTLEANELVIHPDIYGRSAIHSEAVYQALLAAGYNVAEVRAEAVRDLIRRTRGGKEILRVPLDEIIAGIP